MARVLYSKKFVVWKTSGTQSIYSLLNWKELIESVDTASRTALVGFKPYIPLTEKEIMVYMKRASKLEWESFWMGLLLKSLSQDTGRIKSWYQQLDTDIFNALNNNFSELSVWVPIISTHLKLINNRLDQLDDELVRSNCWLFIVYEGLDSAMSKIAIGSLLSLWIHKQNQWERICSKIFLSPGKNLLAIQNYKLEFIRSQSIIL